MRDNLAQEVDRLYRWIKSDLGQILKRKRAGNYTAAVLIVIGCEGLSLLLGKPASYIFIERLMKPRGLSESKAKHVWQALRHGLAHLYETKCIKAGKVKFELIVSWGKMPHLSICRQPLGLILNVRTMRNDLMTVFAEETQRHQSEAGRKRKVPEAWTRERTVEVDEGAHEWEKWFAPGNAGSPRASAEMT